MSQLQTDVSCPLTKRCMLHLLERLLNSRYPTGEVLLFFSSRFSQFDQLSEKQRVFQYSLDWFDEVRFERDRVLLTRVTGFKEILQSCVTICKRSSENASFCSIYIIWQLTVNFTCIPIRSTLLVHNVFTIFTT